MVFDRGLTGKMKSNARSASHNDLNTGLAATVMDQLNVPGDKVVNGLSSELLSRLQRVLDVDEKTERPIHEFDDQGHNLSAGGAAGFCKDLVVSSKSDTELWPKFCTEKAHFPMVAIESLLLLLCRYHERDPRMQQELFLAVCSKLSDYKVIGKTFCIRQLQPHRAKIANFIDNAIKVTKTKMCYPSIKFPSLREEKYFPISRFMPFDVDRYAEDFGDEVLIAKGGFGAVYKATHRLDNVTYAVKKIGFLVQSNEYSNEYSHKIVREVHLYANLPPNSNVVSYKTAWIHYTINRNIERPAQLEFDANDTEMVTEATNPVFNASGSYNYTTFFTKDSSTQPVIEEEDEDSSIRFEDISRDELRSVQMAPLLQQSAVHSTSVRIRELTESETESVSLRTSLTHHAPNIQTPVHMQRQSSTFYSPVDEDDDRSRGIMIPTRRRRTVSEKSDAAKSLSDTAVDYGYVMIPEIETAQHVDQSQYEYLQEATDMKLYATLYIQMELCGQNLKTWIKNRNADVFEKYRTARLKSPSQPVDVLDFLDLTQALVIFKQIVKGVRFLHAHNLIHRDLKPQNIMFNLDNSVVKIGDFGLATLHDSKSIKVDKPRTYLQPEMSTGDGHTADIGTTVYASPEQRRTNNYDVKTDMYSLGVILFELVYPCVTAMEKGKCVDKLKARDLPRNLTAKWPHVAEIILKLTSARPHVRPSAEEVLQKLYPTESKCQNEISKKVAELEATVQRLQRQLNESLHREELLKQEITLLKSLK